MQTRLYISILILLVSSCGPAPKDLGTVQNNSRRDAGFADSTAGSDATGLDTAGEIHDASWNDASQTNDASNRADSSVQRSDTWQNDQTSEPDAGQQTVVLEGSFVVANRTDVDELANVSEITGDLTIQAAGMDLVSLPLLQRIGQELIIVEDVTDGCQSVHMPQLTTVGGFTYEDLQLLSAPTKCNIDLPALNGVDYIHLHWTSAIGRLNLASANNIELRFYEAHLDQLDVSSMTDGYFNWDRSSVLDIRADNFTTGMITLDDYSHTSFALPNFYSGSLTVARTQWNDLTQIDLPRLTFINSLTIRNTRNLLSVNLPMATHYWTLRINDNEALNNLYIPQLRQVNPLATDLMEFGVISICDNAQLDNCDLQTFLANLDNTYLEYCFVEDNNDDICAQPEIPSPSPHLNNCTWSQACGHIAPGGECSCRPDCADSFLECCADVVQQCG